MELFSLSVTVALHISHTSNQAMFVLCNLLLLRVNVRKNQTTFEIRGKPSKIDFAHTFRFGRVMCPTKQDKVSLGFYRFILEKNDRTETKMPLGQAICLFILTIFSGQRKHPS